MTDKELECNRCGICCQQTMIPLPFQAVIDEIKDWQEYYANFKGVTLLAPAPREMGGVPNNFPVILIKRKCDHYDDHKRKCNIYDHRPKPCRDYNCHGKLTRRSGDGV